MSINIEEIKRKLNKLTKKNSRQELIWKPTGEHNVRIVPMQPDPFKERYFYWFLDVPGGVLAPGPTFGKPDPIQELSNKFRQDSDENERKKAGDLYAKLRIYAPVIVRGEEELGVRWWGFGKRVYEQLLNTILDEDFQDITDPLLGHDMKVTYTKGVPGGFPETTVMPRPKATKLSQDSKQASEWMENIPDIDDIFELRSYEEIESLVNRWIASKDSNEDNDSLGTDSNSVKTASNETFDSIDDAFDQLLNE